MAQRLGIPFYYKEMTALAAQESGLDREFVANLNRNAPKVLYDLYLSTRVVRMAPGPVRAGAGPLPGKARKIPQKRPGGVLPPGLFCAYCLPTSISATRLMLPQPMVRIRSPGWAWARI